MRVNASPVREPQPQPKVKPLPQDMAKKEPPTKEIKQAAPEPKHRVDVRA